MGGYYNGDEWRWSLRGLESRGHRLAALPPTLPYLIEKPKPKDGETVEEPQGKLHVPFGFGIREPCPEVTRDPDGNVVVCRRWAGHPGKHEPRLPEGDEAHVAMPKMWDGDDG